MKHLLPRDEKHRDSLKDEGLVFLNLKTLSRVCVVLCFPLLQIVLQTLLAFAVTCYGIVHIAGEFKDMDATSELKNKYVLFLLSVTACTAAPCTN